MALDAKERENAELTAMMETGGNRVAAGVRESKIVEVAKKNRALTLALEKEKAEKARLAVELKAARAGGATDARPRTTSQVETACREVVAEAAFAAESARKECAEWRERAKEAERRAERDAGRFNTARAENERFRAIIKREVGDDKVDFARLEDSLTAAGGWKGRAREIATLRSKVKSLRERLEAHEDGVTVASGSPNSDGSRPTSAVSTVVMTHERAREATARRAELEEASTKLREAEAEAEEAKARAKAAAVRKNVLEKDVRGLREKLEVLKEKSSNDDKLIEALKAEVRKLSEGGAALAFPTARGGSVAAGAAVPAAAYKTLQRRAESQEAKLRDQEQRMLQLRAKIASMEHDGIGGGDGEATEASLAAVAAAAASAGPRDGFSRQHEEDVAALIEHAEGLERATDKLKGKLSAAEKQVEALREQLGAEHQKSHQLRLKLDAARGANGNGNASGTGTGSGTGSGGGYAAAYAASKDGEDAEALREELRAAMIEMERMRKSNKDQIESMEQEVGLYMEMMHEMKRAAGMA